MGLKLKDYLLMLGMLVTGSINTISTKIQLDCTAPGITGLNNKTAVYHKFSKPWMQTFFMFIGESICLLGFAIIRFKKQRKHSLLISQGSIPPISSLTRNSFLSFIFILPTTCDLLGTSVAGIGLVNIDASVWQMMRGSLIIFVGILSLIFLKRVLHLFHWTGMAFAVIGLVLVGLSGFFNQSSDPGSQGGNKVLGVSMVLLGSFISALQMVLEEALLKKRGFHPLQVVGTEGIIGTLVTGFIVLPTLYFIKGTDYGSYENIVDGFYQISQNPTLLINVIVCICSIALYNYFGLSIAKNLTAVHRTLIDALRTVLVWIVNLFIFYVIAHQYGESFDTTSGLLQIDGFAFLMIGTMIYNRVANLNCIPFCYWKEPDNPKMIHESINQDGFNSDEERPLIKSI